jgi:hypothetical protein
MATIPALGARNLPATYYPASQKADGKSANGASGASTNASASTAATQKAGGVASPLSLSNDALDMQKRVASLGSATVDFAQSFMNSFTQALFGDDAKGATIDFDSASLEASSSYALGVAQTSGSDGVRTLAGLSMTDSSHFIGKGTITTADGRKFDFEVEVKYEARLDAVSSSSNSDSDQLAPAGQADKKAQTVDLRDLADLPTVKLPNIDFPGTLSDLFQLIGRDLQSALGSGGDGSDQTSDNIDSNTLRGLSLRLLNLVDSKNTDTYTVPTAAPTAADKAKTAAAYGEQAPVEDDVTMPIKVAPDTATAATDDAFATAPAPVPAAQTSDDPSKPDAAS